MQDDTSFGYGRTESLSTNRRATPAPAVVAEVTTPGITVEQYEAELDKLYRRT